MVAKFTSAQEPACTLPVTCRDPRANSSKPWPRLLCKPGTQLSGRVETILLRVKC